MRATDTSIAVVPDLEEVNANQSAHVVTIVSITPDGLPEVLLGDDGTVVAARLAIRTTRQRLNAAVAQRNDAVVIFERGDRSRPIIVGFIEPLAAPQSAPRDVALEEVPAVEADVDGRRVRLTARDEVVLQCGSASITLRRNGRVIIRGTYVETQSEGTNRIKGGQILMN
jgi:hypothetical protein